MCVCEPIVTSPVLTASRSPAHDAGGAPQGNGSPESMKCVAAYSVAGSWNSTSAGTTCSQKSAVPSSNVMHDVALAARCRQQPRNRVERRHLMVFSEMVELQAELVDVEIDLAVRPATDPVVDQYRDARRRLHDSIAEREHPLGDGPTGHEPSVAAAGMKQSQPHPWHGGQYARRGAGASPVGDQGSGPGRRRTALVCRGQSA